MGELIGGIFVVLVGLAYISFVLYQRKKQAIKVTKSSGFLPDQLEQVTSNLNQTPAAFRGNLNKIKNDYPFSYWHDELFQKEGMQQYKKENCAAAQEIFDQLIEEIYNLGLSAAPIEKLKLLEKATRSLNDLHAKEQGLIETGERETLCDLIDDIGECCGLDPFSFGAGDGIAAEWRTW